jgi:GAF domain-containing protein/ActR/RegA family two-component response regulator/anti-sigma regulatory factor (Ser/Thr protein kinase)
MGEIASPAEGSKPIRNPFKYKGSLDPEANGSVFLFRDELVNHILRRLEEKAWFAIIGGKKVGKTSLVNELIHKGRQKLRSPSVEFLLVKLKDIDYAKEGTLYRETAARIVTQARPRGLSLQRRLRVLPADPTTFKEFLARFADWLVGTEQIILIFDGAEAVPEKQLRQFLATLGIVQSYKALPEFSRYTAIVSGAFHPVDVADPASGPFSEVADVVVLTDFAREEIANWAEKAIRGNGFVCDDSTPRFLAGETGGTAYLAQKICSDVVESAVAERRAPEFTLANVAAAIDAIVERGEANFLWTVQRAEEDPGLVEKMAILLEQRRLDGVSASPGLRKLESLGAISRDGDAAVIRNPLYERGFRKRFTFEHIAQSYFEHRQFDKAQRYYERAIDEHKRAARALRAVFEATQEVSSELELQDIFSRTLEKAREIVESRLCSIMLLDNNTLALKIVAHTGYDADYVRDFSLPLGQGTSGWVCKIGRKRIVRDVQDEVECPEYGSRAMAKRKNVHAFACVPLRYKGEVFGVLNTYLGGAAQFSPLDLMPLETLANQVAAAIKAAQSYDEAETILKTARGLVSLDIGTVLSGIVEACRSIAHSDAVFICYKDPKTARWLYHFPSSIDAPAALPDVKSGQGIAGYVFKTGKAVYWRDVWEQSDAFQYFQTWLSSRSEFAVPLVFASEPDGTEQVLGIMNVESPKLNAFDAQQRRLLSILAIQAAAAIRMAQAHASLEEKTQQVLALSGIGGKIVSSDADYQSTLETIGEESLRIVGAGEKLCFVLVADNLRQSLVIRAAGGLGIAQRFLNFVVPLGGLDGKSVPARAAREKRALLFNDVCSEEARAVYLEIAPEIKSELAAPMVYEGRVIGVIDIESTQPNAFDDDDLRFVQALADAAAVGFKAKEELGTYKRQLEALGRIEGVAADSPSLQPVLQAIADAAAEVVDGTDRRVFLIQLLDKDRHVLTTEVASGREGLRQVYLNSVSESEHKSIGWHVVETGAEYYCPNVSTDPYYMQSNSEIRSSFSVPIRHQQEILGVLGAESTQENDFNEYDMHFLDELGGRVGALITTAKQAEELRRAAEELRATKDELDEQRQKAVVYEAIRMIVHDIRGASSLIAGEVQWLEKLLREDKFEVDALKAAVVNINEQLAEIERTATALREPLNMTPLTVNRHDISKTVAECVKGIEAKAEVSSPAIGVSATYNPSPLFCMIDIHRIRRAFVNILRNAIEALSEQGGTLTVTTGLSEDGASAEVKFRDTGPGIPPSILAKLRQRQFVPSTKLHGTGLGLAIVRAIIENDHKGRLEITSQGGGGTEVVVALPIDRKTTRVDPFAKSPASGYGDLDHQKLTGHRKTKVVLAVNDRQAFLDLISRRLTCADFDVVTATTAEEGLNKCQLRPDLILLDYHLNHEGTITARDFIPRFRKAYPKVPIVVMSATARELEAKDLRVQGIIECSAGYDWTALADTVKRYVAERETPDEPKRKSQRTLSHSEVRRQADRLPTADK